MSNKTSESETLTGSSLLSSITITESANSTSFSSSISIKNSTSSSSHESTIVLLTTTSSSSSKTSSSSVRKSSSTSSSSSISSTSTSSLSSTTSSSISSTSSTSSIIPITSSISVVAVQTVYYSQVYQFTNSDTTLTTELPATTVIDATASFDTNTQKTITQDYDVYKAYAEGHGISLTDTTSKNKTATIAGSVVGSVVGVSIILLLVWFYFKRRNKKMNEKGSFSHAISSTRRYDSQNWTNLNNEKPEESNFSSFIHVFNKNEESSLNPVKQNVLNNRVIDTVFEDSEFEGENKLPSSSYKNTRYQNPGLKINPFEYQTRSILPPIPPPSRKSNKDEFHRHGNNRSSITSVDSSIMSEDTNDDVSTDDSLAQFGQDRDRSHRGGFFREVV